MISRFISLGLAVSLSFSLLFTAPLIINKTQSIQGGILILGLLGILGGFAHAFDFVPRSLFFKFLFNRWVSRVLMASAFFFYN